MNEKKLPKAQLERLASFGNVVFEDEASLKALVNSLDSTNNRHIRIATEGTLLGTIMQHGGIHPDLAILSDDAGQFDALLHALCWINAERSINRLVGFNDSRRDALEEMRIRIW